MMWARIQQGRTTGVRISGVRTWFATACVLMAAACGGGDPAAPNVQPVVTISSAGGSATVVSGVALQLSVRVTNNRGAVVSNPTVVWSSANSSIATVSGSGLVTGALAGSTSITATAEGVSGTFPVTVSPGAPARLGVQRQPAGAASGASLTTQPIVTVLDAAGNVVASSATVVTASLSTGGGVLVGTTTATAANGAATFANLGVAGTIGARTLVFSAPGLTAITSDPFTLEAGAPARLAMRTQPSGAASGAPLLVQPVVEVRDASENLVTNANVAITATIASGGGTITGTTANSVQGLATFSNLALSGVIGTRTLTFSANALIPVTSASIDLVAGAASTLVLQTAPSGGGLNSVFTTQPVVALRDNGGNLATSANVTVNATITSGGGTLTGATSTSLGGVALFNGFGITGTIGTRTISLSSPGLTPVSFTVTPCDQTRSPSLALTPPSGPLVGFFQRQAVADTVVLRDNNGSCTAFSFLNTFISYSGGGSNWLTATSVPGASRIALSANPGVLPVGTYNATVTVSSGNAGNAQFPVTFDVRPAITLTYGSANQKVQQLDPNTTVRIVPQVQMGGVDVPNAPVTFVSRSPTIATVAADGTITGRIGGQAWIVAITSADGGASDSLFVNVTRTTGPLLRADITRFVYVRNVDFSVTLFLDLRGQTAGAASLVFTWPNTGATPGLLRLNNTVPGATGAPVIVSDPATGTTRISIVSATGLTGLIQLGRFDFTPQFAGSSQFVLRIDELIGLDQTSLLSNANALQYPVVIR